MVSVTTSPSAAGTQGSYSAPRCLTPDGTRSERTEPAQAHTVCVRPARFQDVPLSEASVGSPGGRREETNTPEVPRAGQGPLRLLCSLGRVTHRQAAVSQRDAPRAVVLQALRSLSSPAFGSWCAGAARAGGGSAGDWERVAGPKARHSWSTEGWGGERREPGALSASPWFPPHLLKWGGRGGRGPLRQ